MTALQRKPTSGFCIQEHETNREQTFMMNLMILGNAAYTKKARTVATARIIVITRKSI